MPRLPSEITPEMFQEIKTRDTHHWEFLGEQKGGGRKNPKKLYCRCELCDSRHWVMWRWLSEGKTRCCKGCSRKLSPFEIDDFNEKLARNGSAWQLTGQTRSTGSGQRDYRVVCGECKTQKWLRWGTIQPIKWKHCASCAMRKEVAKRTGKTYVPLVLRQPKKKKETETLLPCGNIKVG